MNLVRDSQAQLIAGLVLITGLSLVLVRRVLRRVSHRLHQHAPDEERHLLAELVHRAVGPLSFLACYYALYAVAHVVARSDWVPDDLGWANPILGHFRTLGFFAAGLWYFYTATVAVDHRLRRAAARTPGRFDDVFFPLLGTALRVTVPILAAFALLRLWPVSEDAMTVVRKLLGIALIAAVAWTLRRAVLLVDAAILGTGELASTASDHRALFTRVRMLRRVALVLIGVFAFSAVLMLFDEVRDVGRSILASAGIAGIVLGIAAQRSLGNILAGIQIAVTQPIRLGDQVLVEGDVGNIEEITLTYVVVRVWDQRRIVLPISYFIEKPFQNWTRVASNMLSPLTLRVDFSLPLEDLRRYLAAEVKKSEFWDGKVFGIQVTNADDRTMEVRVLASAPDSGASFNLQCELREKAIDYVREHHPDALPRIRQEQHRIESPTAARTSRDGDRNVDRLDHPLAHAPCTTAPGPDGSSPKPTP
ncbi:mechanosensitive ion channel domain-containing protein [Opitutus sp. ER46]|uniref:mechanosensitive ion channel family protein n=1 Tax=Opitutus sp. ER46 TaxID=2161864 RepID=UPI000D31895E|nr:mechanosensitive ion channel domain-containing protein [Opitutus sp. ER46]PTX91326.1 hypothetical protein DB354_15630 [Opitutus sp. ER46]